MYYFFIFMNAFHFCCLFTRKPHETCRYTINVDSHFYFQTRYNNNTIITSILYCITNIMIIYALIFSSVFSDFLTLRAQRWFDYYLSDITYDERHTTPSVLFQLLLILYQMSKWKKKRLMTFSSVIAQNW